MGVVYLLTNAENGKRYVGKTVKTLEERWQGHCNSARRDDNDMYVCRAIAKWGAEAFERKVLEECPDEELANRERHWITELKTHISQGGYNLTLGGEGLHGYVFSDESKELMRQKALGRKHNEETKQKMRLAKLGKKQTPEHIAARVAVTTGKKRTEEQRKRIADGNRGKKRSPEAIANITRGSTGRVTSEKTKKKLSESCTGWHQSDDVKKRISEARSKSVVQFSADGVLLNEYPSIKEAVRLSGVSSISLSRSLKEGRARAGYLWKYKESGV